MEVVVCVSIISRYGSTKMSPEAFTDFTALGLVALMIVLGYYAVQKLGTILTKHLARQNRLLERIEVNLLACIDRLDHIQESFQKVDKT